MIALLLGGLCGVANASGTLSFQFENDVFAGTDRHFTNAIRLSWITAPKPLAQSWLHGAVRDVYRPTASPVIRYGFTVGQSLYTPEDISAPQLLVDERPYAGWLYGAVSFAVEADSSAFGTNLDLLDTVELQLGVVGPAALGRETQQFVHNIIGAQRPNGWDNQLEDELGVALIFDRKARLPTVRSEGVELDAIPGFSVSVGNVDTSLTLGGIVRFGQGLDVDYGVPRVRPNFTGLEAFDAPAGGNAWYVFAGATGRLVLRNIFLDGNSFKDSHRVDKRPLVGDFQLGAAMILDRVRLTLTFNLRTKEFEGQNLPDRWGAFSAAVRF